MAEDLNSMRRAVLQAISAIALLTGILVTTAKPCYAETGPAKTRVIVLGVNHSAQLVSEKDSPATLAAFVHRLRPDAICIERAPDRFARGDLYEFTYEIQNAITPSADHNQIPLCPFDWSPPVVDQELGFGINVETPPELRAPADFQGFLFFPDPAALRRDIFAAENPEVLKSYVDFATKPAASPSNDFARRLFLYRTFLQARRVQAAAAKHPGGTVLVVVGEFHKHDLEAYLYTISSIRVVSPAAVGRPTAAEVAAATTPEQQAAILSFNLLGRQAETRNVNWAWVGEVLVSFERRGTAETRLFRLRFNALTGHFDAQHLAQQYLALAKQTPDAAAFTWTGVLDATRIDSYFDPYGNLNIAQRARLEAARATLASDPGAARKLVRQLGSELSPRKARQLEAYWRRDEQQVGRAA